MILVKSSARSSRPSVTRTTNCRLLVVQPLVMDGDQPEPNEDFIARDSTPAGIGDTVLVNREGNGRARCFNIPDGAVISVIVGIVDLVYVEG